MILEPLTQPSTLERRRLSAASQKNPWRVLEQYPFVIILASWTVKHFLARSPEQNQRNHDTLAAGGLAGWGSPAIAASAVRDCSSRAASPRSSNMNRRIPVACPVVASISNTAPAIRGSPVATSN